MTEIYEAFLWWLILWLPSDSYLGWLIYEGTRSDESEIFWGKLSPDRDYGDRDRRRDEELQRVRIQGITSRATVLTRRQNLKGVTV